MKHVYVLQSLSSPGRHYVGATFDVARRLQEHNAGESIHTRKFGPWQLKISIAFGDEDRADAFERYLKSGSGRAFIKRHFA